MYLVVMDYKLLKQGNRQTNLSTLLGAIITQFLTANERWIQEEFYRVKQRVVTEGVIPRFFDLDQLTEIEATSGADISELVRIGWNERRRKSTKKKGAV